VNGETYDFGAQEKKANDDAFDAIYDRFVKCGVGVVLGEFGAIDKGSDDSRLAYFEYVAKLAKQKGMAYMVWDNNSYSGDAPFGLIDRAAVIDKEKEILDVLVK
jgi:endoglucanase